MVSLGGRPCATDIDEQSADCRNLLTREHNAPLSFDGSGLDIRACPLLKLDGAHLSGDVGQVPERASLIAERYAFGNAYRTACSCCPHSNTKTTLERVLAAGPGPPDVLVNSAGIDSPPSGLGGGAGFGDLPKAVSGVVLDVNALGTLQSCQVFGTAMAAAGGGSIVNIGSLYAGLAPDPRLYEHIRADPPFLKPPAYGMSKAAVAALTLPRRALGPGGGAGEHLVARRGARRRGRRVRGQVHRQSTARGGPLLFLASAQLLRDRDRATGRRRLRLLVTGQPTGVLHCCH
jgi:hypothetical protein